MEAPKRKIDLSILENLITGRVYPHIYAFSTDTVPKYWKVGDTVRPVNKRLAEWSKHYTDLRQEYCRAARIGNSFFRDYAIHRYLEYELGKERLQKEDMPKGLYYSNEFFKDINVDNLEDAFRHIEQDVKQGGGIYQLYNEQHLPEIPHYERDTEPYNLRPNQEKAVEAFMEAKDKGRTKLLMYAVMLFGKSFTSMCCANAMDAKIVVIVSGKADVKEEWKKTVEKIANFDGFVFLDGEQLSRDENIIKSNIESGKKVAIFLTLQDLQGDEIKEKHKEVFDSQIDLLIVDETHYGARAAEYGKVLQNAGLTKAQINKELSQKDIEYVEDVDAEIQKHLKARITLHLSGTPYRILMSSEFSEDDIVSFCQFTDIIDESDKWIDDNNKKEEPEDEWENPYYGFPQMIRFAFTPNESSLQKIKQLKELGTTATLSALFRPQSIEKDAAGNYKKFENESEVCDLLRAIDGSQEDENIFSFLNYDKIKEGEMCHHMVFVLPYRASCDAMQELITNNPDKFDNLSQYEIINIAGVDGNTLYPSVDAIKSKIKRYESEGKKTITLTVNRMLTGNTVEEWDTMIFLKDTASPQEYDQAIFRLQNQYVVTYEDAEGKTIKYNKKPQTLLVDFDVDRMFRLQELKSQFYNANTDADGNEKLEARLNRELEISPIICLNKDKLHQVTSANIMDAVREYSQSRSVMDEATDIPVDEKILTDAEILSIIRDLVPIDSPKGITFKPIEGEGEDIGTPDDGEAGANEGDQPNEANGSQGGDGTEAQPQPSQDESKELAKKLRTYYLQILFFAFLTESKVDNLRDIIDVLSANDDNKRIAGNLGLNIDKLDALHSKCSHFIHSKLDYKIKNINNLISDETMEPIKRAEVALTQFGRMSDSEIVTPKNIAKDMIDMLPDMDNIEEVKFLDIASKQGEFAYAIYNRFAMDNDAVKNNIYSLPTSKLCYEFTRKIYKLLNMPIENIIADFTTYDIIQDDSEDKIMKLNNMNFNVIVGNPPYHKSNGGGLNRSSGTAIYDDFVSVAKSLSPRFINMIMPSRWFGVQGGKLETFRNTMLEDKHISTLHDYNNAEDCFGKSVELKGGVCYFLRDTEYNGDCNVNIHSGNEIISETRTLKNQFTEVYVRYQKYLDILQKVQTAEESSFSTMVSPNDPFGFDTRIEGTMRRVKVKPSLKPFKTGVEFYYHGWRTRGVGYVERDSVKRNKEWIDKVKILIPKAWGVGNVSKDSLSPFIVSNPSCCYETYLVVGTFENISEANNAMKYIQTKFFHLLVAVLKNTQNAMQGAYKYVPLQNFTSESDIDWSKSIADIDKQLYAKYGLDESEIAFIESKVKSME